MRTLLEDVYLESLIDFDLFQGILVDLYVPRKCAATSEHSFPLTRPPPPS